MIRNIFITGLFLCLPAIAKDQMKCEVQGAVRCACPASLTVSCEGYDRPHYIDDNQKVNQIKAVISANGRTKEVILDKPAKAVRDYYGGTTLREELRTAGHNIGEFEDVHMKEVTVDSDIPLYTGPGEDFGKVSDIPLAKKSGSGGSGDDGPSCSYLTAPSVATVAACGKQKICFAMVTCKGLGDLHVGCLAAGDGSCPTAKECAKDEKVAMGKAKNARDFAEEVRANKAAKQQGPDKEHGAGGGQ